MIISTLKHTPEEKIAILEKFIFGGKEREMAEEEKKVIDGQHPFFSKKHYYDEDGMVISKEEAYKN